MTSLTNIPLVTSAQKPLTELINNIPNILSADVDKKLAKEEILSSPIYKDLVISSDARTTAMQIIIEKNQKLLDALNERNLFMTNIKVILIINLDIYPQKLIMRIYLKLKNKTLIY